MKDEELIEEHKKDSLGDGWEFTILAILVLIAFVSLRVWING